MAASSYYELLGVSDTSSLDDIKRAYRQMTFKYHPDRNGNSAESNAMTQRLNEAYETLSDEGKRRRYDFSRRMRGMGGLFGMSDADERDELGGGGGIHMFEMDLGNLGPLFSVLGGGMPFHRSFSMMNGGAVPQLSPIITTVSISLVQSYTGCTVPVDVERWVLQDNGSKLSERERLFVSVPEGVDSGEQIVVRGRGNRLHEDMCGDVVVRVLVKNDTIFARSGLDLVIDMSLSLREALCGFAKTIEHPNGKSITLNQRSGNVVQHGYTKKYPGMGFRRDGQVGAMVLVFSVSLPTTLTAEQTAELARILA